MTSNNGDNEMQNVIINGVEYAPIKQATGTRAVIVVDRGWIFAGNVTRANGRIKLANALHVFKWDNIWFVPKKDDEQLAIEAEQETQYYGA